MATEANVCAECGAPINTNAPQGPCPQCLLEGGLKTQTDLCLSPDEAKTVVGPAELERRTPNVERSTSNRELTSARSSRITDHASLDRVRYFGDYELLEEIARGGMGVVYKARQVSLNRVVAVKMILAGQLASEAEVKRFRTEAEAAANLQHPNIVAIHEVGEHQGQHYFSMDYIEGQNLSAFIAGRPMPAARAAQMVQAIAEAIHYAHQRGTLHRDLKPQNVLMDENVRPHITDFGLAKQFKQASELTHTGAVMGSPSYMPPEQAAGRQDLIGPTSDVYSLGAILYELLTGQAPFRAETPMATLLKVMEEQPVSPRKVNPFASPDLETVCLKCLEKRPERRYSSARLLAEDLERFLKHEPIQARPASDLRKAWAWAQNHSWVINGALTVLLLGLFCVAYGLWSENQFLKWKEAYPNSVAKPGLPVKKLDWEVFFIVPIMLWATYGRFFREQARKRKLERHPLGTGFLAASATLALTGIVFGFYLALKFIDTCVWEGKSIAGAFMMSVGAVLACGMGVGLGLKIGSTAKKRKQEGHWLYAVLLIIPAVGIGALGCVFALPVISLMIQIAMGMLAVPAEFMTAHYSLSTRTVTDLNRSGPAILALFAFYTFWQSIGLGRQVWREHRGNTLGSDAELEAHASEERTEPFFVQALESTGLLPFEGKKQRKPVSVAQGRNIPWLVPGLILLILFSLQPPDVQRLFLSIGGLGLLTGFLAGNLLLSEGGFRRVLLKVGVIILIGGLAFLAYGNQPGAVILALTFSLLIGLALAAAISSDLGK